LESEPENKGKKEEKFFGFWELDFKGLGEDLKFNKEH